MEGITRKAMEREAPALYHALSGLVLMIDHDITTETLKICEEKYPTTSEMREAHEVLGRLRNHD